MCVNLLPTRVDNNPKTDSLNLGKFAAICLIVFAFYCFLQVDQLVDLTTDKSSNDGQLPKLMSFDL